VPPALVSKQIFPLWFHRTGSLQNQARSGNFSVSLKNAVFLDATPCGSCKNRRFGGTYRLHHQADKNRWTRNNFSRN
jgi:hypothetical protein